MITALRLLGIAVLIFLIGFTSTKLLKMAKIRGVVAGPAPEVKTITSKEALPGSNGESYWLAWDGANIQFPGRNRINLPEEVWLEYDVGDSIEIFYFPGDRWPYHKRDIFADTGNFVFDFILLTIWIVGLCVLVIFQFFSVGRGRKQKLPPPLPRS
jgi:hypothetical protein